jgi:hypothetical protein
MLIIIAENLKNTHFARRKFVEELCFEECKTNRQCERFEIHLFVILNNCTVRVTSYEHSEIFKRLTK